MKSKDLQQVVFRKYEDGDSPTNRDLRVLPDPSETRSGLDPKFNTLPGLGLGPGPYLIFTQTRLT